MSDNLLDKVSSFSERLKIGGAEVSRKMTEGMSSVSEKVKELFQGPNQTDKLVEEATAETLDEPDWATNLELCDMINLEKITSVELIRGIKKRIMLKSPRVQFLALVLLETVVKNCDKAFSEVAAERVLDEMVKLIDDPQTVINSRNKALILIEAWGESSDELRYLPVFEETYKSLKSRGIRFPGRDNESLAPIFTPTPSVTSSETNDNLAQHIPRDILPVVTFSAEQTREELEVARNSAELLSTVLSSSPGEDASEDEATVALVQQCHQSQFTVQRMIETAGENEALMFEALNVNDELLKVLAKYEDLKKPEIVRERLEPAMIPVAVEPDESLQWKEDDTTTLVRKPAGSRAGVNNNNNDDMMDDLDEMIFGKKTVAAAAAAGSNSEGAGDAKKNQQASKDDLISF